MGAFYGVVSAEGCPTTSLPQKSVSIQNHIVDYGAPFVTSRILLTEYTISVGQNYILSTECNSVQQNIILSNRIRILLDRM